MLMGLCTQEMKTGRQRSFCLPLSPETTFKAALVSRYLHICPPSTFYHPLISPSTHTSTHLPLIYPPSTYTPTHTSNSTTYSSIH